MSKNDYFFLKGALIIKCMTNSDFVILIILFCVKAMESFRMLNAGMLSISRLHKPV